MRGAFLSAFVTGLYVCDVGISSYSSKMFWRFLVTNLMSVILTVTQIDSRQVYLRSFKAICKVIL